MRPEDLPAGAGGGGEVARARGELMRFEGIGGDESEKDEGRH